MNMLDVFCSDAFNDAESPSTPNETTEIINRSAKKKKDV
jgi:hypothetical protein